MNSVLSALIRAIRSVAVYNPDVQAAPACILWSDHNRQWEAVIPRLQMALPELFVLGGYAPEKRTGPAIWLRCVLAGKIPVERDPADEDKVKERQKRFRRAENIPVFYLPGFGRQDLRAVENCPQTLKPLAELQYRGVVWSQSNGKDWTILAFIQSEQGGLGLDVARDNGAKNAMQLALHRFLDEEIALLKNQHLDKDYFNTLLTGGDPRRDLLQWLDQGDAFRAGRGENEWAAFVEICKSQLAFNPQDEGPLAAAEKLAKGEGPWRAVWERFCEAPRRYPHIPALIRKCTMPLELFANAQSHGGWPQWNEGQENSLRTALLELGDVPAHQARQRIAKLEKSHGERRELVWVELGESPLVAALQSLAMLAEATANPLTAGTLADLAAGYAASGWKADAAVWQSLAGLQRDEDIRAVTTAVRAIYSPWVEDAARYLQGVVAQEGYPLGMASSLKAPLPTDGECMLFVDGLRYDVARRLGEMLTQRGFAVASEIAWAALPSVTATGKPAVSPVRELIHGLEATSDFEPVVRETGRSLKGGHAFKKLLQAKGWRVLEKSETGDGSGRAWCAFGNIDHEGHERGWKLSRFIEELLTEIADRVARLLAAGWKTVRIVTDHGWLLLPGGLPKMELSPDLVENKWGRCAALKAGVVTEELLLPWYWNPGQSVVLANGIGCFRAGQEYAHGGLSLQECLTLALNVTAGQGGQGDIAATITDVVWKGLRCKVALDGEFAGLFVDIRTKAGNPDDSVVMNVKPINDNGMASVVVEDEDLEGAPASIVLIDKDGRLIAQENTIIGGGAD